MTRTAVVICPGRGTYNQAELGYLGRHHADKTEFLAMLDRFREEQGQVPITELDGADRYSASLHTRGDNASPLIYGCAYGDFLSIDNESIDIVAVTGNSMGWYIALACAGALSETDAMAVINTMGTLMQDNLIGGQLVYPVVDSDWHIVPGQRDRLESLVETIAARESCALYLSIDLGGMLVFAGEEVGLDALAEALEPVDDRFPMRLKNHAAFHTPLLEANAQKGRSALPDTMFRQPRIPLIDGRGSIWYPGARDPEALWEYTLGHQVTQPYDFALAVQVAAREFAPDYLIVTGPGTTLGGSVAQSLIAIEWQGLTGKAAFLSRQATDPVVVSMGMDEQRVLATD